MNQDLTKKVKIELERRTANILWDLLTYNKLQYFLQMNKDAFKDNDWIIEVIDLVCKQIEEGIK